MEQTRRPHLYMLAILVLALAGCGGDDPPAARAPVDVVKAWAEAVREGDFEAANDLFAVPAKIANGAPPVILDDREKIDAFNRSLPCGAIVKNAQEIADDYVRVTFQLTEGRGCGSGTGNDAEVSFKIVDGRIVEWLREAPGAPPGTTEI